MILAADWGEVFGGAAVTFVSVSLLGGAVGWYWSNASHRRERDLEAVGRFGNAYGTWFATWKEWEAVCDSCQSEGERKQHPSYADLLRAATKVEGDFETLLVKIVIDRRLSDIDVARLGRFREGYQRLRESIEAGTELPFRVQYDDTKVQAYATFKALSVEFADRLRSQRARPLHPGTWRTRPKRESAEEAFVRVTSWRTIGNAKTDWYRNPGSNAPDKALSEWCLIRSIIDELDTPAASSDPT